MACPAFLKVVGTVSDAYRNRRREVEQATQQIMTALSSRTDSNASAEPLTVDILNQAYFALRRDFDSINGGFGQAPKFPQPMVLEFLLRYYHRTGDKDALEMATLTLEKMAKGGIYDQIGGGFHRYATDSHWLVPHFEKMLYDNALLSQIYLHAYQITKSPLFRRIAEETIDYVLREMTSPQGGFYCTQDADSEGKEGKYYVWAPDEIKKALGKKKANILGDYYGLTEGGNFEGRNILHVSADLPPEESGIISQAKVALLKEREKRVRPGRDDKILASWNGLMLCSLAEAACVFDRNDYLEAAIANGSFLLNSMTSDGYLRHSRMDGKARIDGYLEDYALVVEGLLNLHQATFGGKWLGEAIRLAGLLADNFWDRSAGTFYDTSRKHQALFIRPRSNHDGASPSGSSAATLALLKISRLTGDERLEQIAVHSLRTMQTTIARYPLGFGNWLCALDLHLSVPKEVVLVGSRHNPATSDLLRVIFDAWLPNKVFAALDHNDPAPMADLALFEGRGMISNKPTVYICERGTCRPPVNEPNLLYDSLHESGY